MHRGQRVLQQEGTQGAGAPVFGDGKPFRRAAAAFFLFG